MKIGLIGGSFDPIHSGHLAPAREARDRFGLDRVVYLPTAVPPHKPGREMAPAHRRFTMVELALLYEDGLEASPLELTPGRPAYTIDSVERFAATDPGTELYLLLGADSFVALPTWRRWRDLAAATRLIVLARPGWSHERTLDEVPEELSQLAASDRVAFLRNRPVDVSSTGIREMLERGERPPEGWLPGLVLDYCLKYRLYSA